MFRLIKRLVFFALLVGILALLAWLFLPNTYEGESSIAIQASKPAVFAAAVNLDSWNLLAIYGEWPGDLSWDNLSGPGSSYQPTVDSLVSSVRHKAEAMKVRFRITERQEPDRIAYEALGGPINGLQAEIILVRDGEESSHVTLKERIRFDGFFGSLKAFAAKQAGSELRVRSLMNLKNICEVPRKDLK